MVEVSQHLRSLVVLQSTLRRCTLAVVHCQASGPGLEYRGLVVELLLKCFDSNTDGRARFAPHTAFVDPTTPPDAPPRESIELRTLVFHAS